MLYFWRLKIRLDSSIENWAGNLAIWKLRKFWERIWESLQHYSLQSEEIFVWNGRIPQSFVLLHFKSRVGWVDITYQFNRDKRRKLTLLKFSQPSKRQVSSSIFNCLEKSLSSRTSSMNDPQHEKNRKTLNPRKSSTYIHINASRNNPNPLLNSQLNVL